MELFFRIFQHLLPRARAWRVVLDKSLRKFFEGLSGVGADVKEYYDLIFLDLFSLTTRQLPEWEKQFAILNPAGTESERRSAIAGRFQAFGGQSPRYLQDVLQASGFDVYVHEWWEPGSNPPDVRSPHHYLQDNEVFQWLVTCGDGESTCGGTGVTCGARLDVAALGYPLVNKPAEVNVIPLDDQKWPYFVYVGGEIFPDFATVSANRKNEFETLMLKTFPAHLWIGVLVNYS